LMEEELPRERNGREGFLEESLLGWGSRMG
jgi:hypothetical protein